MRGAETMKGIVRRLSWRTDIGREIELAEIAEKYGAGFADAIRLEINGP